MAVKEIPINYRTYYKLFIETYKQKLEDAIELKVELEDSIKVKYSNISAWKDIYKKEFNIDLDNYNEFVNNKYITGNFYKASKGLLINKQNDYELITDLFNLFDLADTQKQIYDLLKSIEIYKRCISIKMKDYVEVLRTYYTEVHKRLILEGEGYAFTNNIGWICVNRCIIDKKKPILNYTATKRREKELLAQGKRIYNKEEAEWCAKNGIEYKAEDKRVFICNEVCYQIPLISSKLKNGDVLKLEISDYRHSHLRGKTNEDLIEMCDRDVNKICELPVDLKTKLTLCNKIDKILYTKFIRNETQKPIVFTKASR